MQLNCRIMKSLNLKTGDLGVWVIVDLEVRQSRNQNDLQCCNLDSEEWLLGEVAKRSGNVELILA